MPATTRDIPRIKVTEILLRSDGVTQLRYYSTVLAQAPEHYTTRSSLVSREVKKLFNKRIN